MKTGRSLKDIAQELARQRAAKRDFLADTRNVRVDLDDKKQLVAAMLRPQAPPEFFPIRSTALRQVEEHLGVPAKFADRLLDKHPDLLAYNLNELLHRTPSTQLIRTLDTQVRAFLSDSYRIIDNFDFANAVLDVAAKFPCEVVSCEVTEHRLYVKVVRTDMEEVIGYKEGWEQGKGHNLYNRIRPASVFSNSEIGSGSLWFRPAVFTKECTNLAVWEDDSFRKVHLGAKGSAGEDGIWEVLSDKTKALSDAALWSQVKDLTAAALGGKLFEKQVAQLKGATERKIEGDVVKTVELAAARFQLTEAERSGVLDHLIKGGDLSQYGLHSAVTRFSADVVDYDRASELERLGGRIIELPQGEWQQLARAA
jgi:hypothetical protein